MVAAVDPYLIDWLDLAFRFLHVIAAIVWIGTSFYFVALDNHLRPAKERDDLTGESWEIHGGGFYRIEKFRVTPPTIPEPLHWYKWEAYTTWLAGFALFVSLYYLQPRTYLIDASVADISPAVAIGTSIALLAVAWLVYDALCRTVGARSDALLGACMLGDEIEIDRNVPLHDYCLRRQRTAPVGSLRLASRSPKVSSQPIRRSCRWERAYASREPRRTTERTGSLTPAAPYANGVWTSISPTALRRANSGADPFT